MNPEKLLIIEDDPAILFGLRDNFSRAGYEVKVAAEGKLGLELALSWKPQLLLLDLMLPGLDGYQICQELRRAECDFPIIMLTALGQEEQVIKGLNLGADDYVTKPFSIQQLLARVAAFLRRRRLQTPAVIRLGDLEVNLTAHRPRSPSGRQLGVNDSQGIRSPGILSASSGPRSHARANFERRLGAGCVRYGAQRGSGSDVAASEN